MANNLKMKSVTMTIVRILESINIIAKEKEKEKIPIENRNHQSKMILEFSDRYDSDRIYDCFISISCFSE